MKFGHIEWKNETESEKQIIRDKMIKEGIRPLHLFEGEEGLNGLRNNIRPGDEVVFFDIFNRSESLKEFFQFCRGFLKEHVTFLVCGFLGGREGIFDMLDRPLRQFIDIFINRIDLEEAAKITVELPRLYKVGEVIDGRSKPNFDDSNIVDSVLKLLEENREKFFEVISREKKPYKWKVPLGDIWGRVDEDGNYFIFSDTFDKYFCGKTERCLILDMLNKKGMIGTYPHGHLIYYTNGKYFPGLGSRSCVLIYSKVKTQSIEVTKTSIQRAHIKKKVFLRGAKILALQRMYAHNSLNTQKVLDKFNISRSALYGFLTKKGNLTKRGLKMSKLKERK